MKLQLLCLGLMLLCTQGEGDEVVRGNFDLGKISGNWYTVEAASDKRQTIEEGGIMRVFLESIEPVEDSALYFTFWIHASGECKQFSFTSNRVAEGVYTDEYEGYNVFRLVETDYTNYIILQLRNFKAEGSFQLLQLYGREPDVSGEIKTKFEDFCHKNGIGEGNIIDMTTVDRCLQARGEK
uniref:Lipocalin/cytosolic fatty-acid binding domain-containing protein n=1 Tax=Cavia porcellus TaxID=10141 RepID=A0A286XJD1_CAVPO|nr:allergen Fel d 4-like [Cavia porcellus]